MHQRTRKHMAMHQALHFRDDIDKLDVSRKEGGRGLTSIQDSVDASKHRQEDCIKNANKDWLPRIETMRTTQASIEQKWDEKPRYGHFKRQTSKISLEKT